MHWTLVLRSLRSLLCAIANFVMTFFPGVIFVQAAEKGRTGVAGFLTPFSIGIFGWVLALMTEQPWLLFYSCGYLASLAQGVCHTLSGEDGTLAKLHNIRDEYAHTTYFPCLVLQSVIQTADAEKKKGDATKGKKD